MGQAYDTAFDKTNNVYLLVYNTYAPLLKAQWIDVNGVPVGTPFTIGPGDSPRLLYEAADNAFLMTYQQGGARRAVFLRYAGTSNPPTVLTPTPLVLGTLGWITDTFGGMVYVPGTGSYLVTWWDAPGGPGRSFVRSVRLDGTMGSTITLTPIGQSNEMPDISCGPNECLVVGKFYDDAAASRGLWARWLDLNGTPTGNVFYLDLLPNTHDDPLVLYNPLQSSYLVTFTRDMGLPRGMRLAPGATTGSAPVSTTPKLGGQTRMVYNPWTQTFVQAMGGWAEDVFAQALDSLGSPAGSYVIVSNGPTKDSRTAIAANPSLGQFLVVYRHDVTNLRGILLQGAPGTGTPPPPPPTYALTVSKAGTGSGTVASSPSGINCGSDCSETFAGGTVVTLTATPASGSTFSGWSGDADCSDGSVTMSAARSCIATFTLAAVPTYALNVSVTGTGSGTVTSNPAGISCGSDCSESYASGTVVTLTATPASGSVFVGWSGTGCTGGVVTMSAARSCAATFSTAGGTPPALSVAGPGAQVVNDPSVVDRFDVAFDATRQQYLVVWSTWQQQVKGVLLDAQGQALGSAFTIASGIGPRVAYGSTTQAYLVTYTNSAARWARAVTPGTGGTATLGTAVSLGTLSWVAAQGNSGGSAWIASSNTFLTTWWDGGANILVRGVGPSGPTGAATLLSASDTQELPEIACGPAACLVVGRTWDQVIWGRWVSVSGAATSARFTIEQGAGAREMVHVAHSDMTGTFTVVWARDGIPQRTTLAAGATAGTPIQPVVAGQVGTQLGWAYNSGLGLFALAAQSNASTIWAHGVDAAGTPVTGTVLTVSEVATTDGRPVVAANPLASQFLVLYRPTLQTLRTRLLGGGSASGYSLTVSRVGTGSGTVTSNPAGISCGTDCSESYASGTVVTVTATPAAGSVFAGWSGTGCASGTVTLNASTACTATFNLAAPPSSYTLTVVTSGGGTVASNPAGISCGTDCSESYASGTVVTLTATPASGWTFAGWSGTGCASGTVTLNASTTCTATFTTTYLLNVAIVGTGSGTITSSPAGISCGPTCSAVYASGTVVTLTATPASGSVFGGWSGTGCAGGVVTMSAVRSCAATFSTAGGTPPALSVAGPGAQVVDDPSVVDKFDVAFDATRQQYLVVWNTWGQQVKGVLLDAQGRALGSAFTIASGIGPRVAYGSTTQAYLVTYTNGAARWARAVTPGTGGTATLGTAGTLGPVVWVAEHGNRGGSAWIASSNTFLTTWWDGGANILVRGVGPSGPTGAATLLSASDTQELPEIACGPAACLVVGRTWDQVIWGRWISVSGAATSARFTIEQGSATREWARVAYSESAGTFTVVWARDGIPQRTTLAAGATAGTPIQPVVAGQVGTQLGWAYNTGLDLFALAAQGNASTIWAQGADATGTPMTSAVLTVSEVATTDGRPVLVANPATSQFLVVYRPTLQTLRTRLFGSSAPVTYSLVVSTTGTGTGTVTSNPAGISCGSDCSESYASGTVVTLTATPASGSQFMGWASADADCSDGSVTMSGAHSCIAVFDLAPSTTYPLSVSLSGTGSGTVTSNPAGISCGSDCSESYASGTVVTLAATPASGSVFGGWSGTGCTGGVVTMSAARSCAATFSTAGGTPPALSVAGPGGQVVNDPSVVDKFDVAFDATRQQYLVVWSTWQQQVKGVLLDAQGQALGSAFTIASGTGPQVAYGSTTQAYLVTYTNGAARWARAVTPGTGGTATLGTAGTLGPVVWVAEHGNRGGSAWIASSNTFLTTWWDGGANILVRGVGPSGPTGTATALTAADTQELPEIACGPSACLVVGRTWDQVIWGRWISVSGAATSARFTIEQGSATREWARVAYSESAGTFTVAWVRAGIPQTTTLAAGATTVGAIQPVVAGQVGSQLDLAYNSELNVFAVAAQGNASTIWAQGADATGTPMTSAVLTVSEVATTDGRPVIVANPATRQFLVVYRPTLQTLRTRFLQQAP